jgi:hypothetical protein
VERVWEGKYRANTVYTCMYMEKWDQLKLFQEWGVWDKGEPWKEWIQVLHTQYIISTFVNATVYPYLAQ